ncbi:alpha/beta hydrolase family protein [Nocardioides sp. B-3]|uniref:alpha/beta hydrolase family protein n=1 Tax=Nocardioides sp. B-3 TaxID=2895565 RepID=UPI002153860F|nr:prolyl oligopeptidase family serine peptidase [Nocardioides sp. B-3]UUZ61877.1 prolyl oligopeptidase family serine peptidase [Nocardioides sp. B-3]
MRRSTCAAGGMTRERGVFASRGYVALHVDYRGHAESTDDPRSDRDLRLGYSADVIAAVKALRASPDVPVDDDRIALMGRSMGGGVVMKALIASPGLVQAASLWASVSSLEGETFDHFIRRDDDSRGAAIVTAHGLPEDEPDFWAAASARPYLSTITEPVLIVHGRVDDTCPPRWARPPPGRHAASRGRLDARVVRRRARLRTGVRRRDGPHGPLLRRPAVISS